jgi:hypothetical protein
MSRSSWTFCGLLCLALSAVTYSASAQGGGVPALGYYRPCLISPTIQKAEIIKPVFEQTVIVRAEIERAVIVLPTIERPYIEPAKILVPEMVRPEYINPCVDATSAAYSAALVRSASVLGLQFDVAGHIASRKTAEEMAAAAMLPPEAAARALARKDSKTGALPNAAGVPTVNTTCCGEVPATPPANNFRIRVRK